MSSNTSKDFALLLAINLCCSLLVLGQNANEKCASSQISEQQQSHMFTWKISGLVDHLDSNETFQVATENITFNSVIVPGNWMFLLCKQFMYPNYNRLELMAIYEDTGENAKSPQLKIEVTPELSANGNIIMLNTTKNPENNRDGYGGYEQHGHSIGSGYGTAYATVTVGSMSSMHHPELYQKRFLVWKNVLDSVKSITSSANPKDFTLKFRIKSTILQNAFTPSSC